MAFGLSITSDMHKNKVFFSFYLGSGGVKLEHTEAGCSIIHYVERDLLTVSQSNICGAGTVSCLVLQQ